MCALTGAVSSWNAATSSSIQVADQPLQPDRAADHDQQDAEHLRLGARVHPGQDVGEPQQPQPGGQAQEGPGQQQDDGDDVGDLRARSSPGLALLGASGRPTSWPSPVGPSSMPPM